MKERKVGTRRNSCMCGWKSTLEPTVLMFASEVYGPEVLVSMRTRRRHLRAACYQPTPWMACSFYCVLQVGTANPLSDPCHGSLHSRRGVGCELLIVLAVSVGIMAVQFLLHAASGYCDPSHGIPSQHSGQAFGWSWSLFWYV